MNLRILRNTSAYVLAGLLPYAVNFFMLPVYTRFMTPDDYGILSLINAFIAFLICFMGLKMDSSLARYYFDCDEEGVARLFSTLLFAILAVNTAILAVLHLFGGLVTSLVFPRAGIPYAPHVLLALVIVFFSGVINFSNIALRVQERGAAALAAAVLNAGSGVLFAVYFVVYRGLGVRGFLTGMALTAALHSLALVWMMRSSLRPVFDAAVIPRALSYGLPIIPHALGGVLFMMSDRFILGYFVPLAGIGLYNIADRIAMLLRLMVISFADAVQPSFMRKAVEDREEALRYYGGVTVKWAAAVACAVLALAMFGGELVRVLTPPAYHAAAAYIPVLLGAYLFHGLYSFPVHLILFEKKTRVIPLITFTAGVVNVLANLVFVPRYGVMAAAWTTLFSYALIFFLALRISRRYGAIPFRWGAMLAIFGSMAAVFAFSRLIATERVWLDAAVKLALLGGYAAALLRLNPGGAATELRALLLQLRRKAR